MFFVRKLAEGKSMTWWLVNISNFQSEVEFSNSDVLCDAEKWAFEHSSYYSSLASSDVWLYHTRLKLLPMFGKLLTHGISWPLTYELPSKSKLTDYFVHIVLL